MKKLIAFLLCAVMLAISLTSCGRVPEMSELEGRLAELIEASYEINDMFFGEGLPTYERVSDPKNGMKTIRAEDGSRVTYYYELSDEGLGRVVAYRVATMTYSFAQIAEQKDNTREAIWQDTEKGLYAYAVEYTHEKTSSEKVETIKDEVAGTITYYYELTDEALGRVVAHRTSDLGYTYVQVLESPDPSRAAVYENETDGVYAYVVPYTETVYELYYTSDDPTDYDYVRSDADYLSIQSMKDKAATVYSKDFLAGIYQVQFEGIVSEDESLKGLEPRYYEYTDDYGSVLLMKSNTYEPLIHEKRIFDLSTAEIVRPKRKKFVTISIESHMESTPDRRETNKLTMILQDGVWMLDSATY